MEDRETARMRKYGESKTTRIMMATASHVISGLGLRKFQADGFLLTRVYTLRYTDFPEKLEESQNCRRQTGDPKQDSRRGPTNSRLHDTRFSSLGFVYSCV